MRCLATLCMAVALSGCAVGGPPSDRDVAASLENRFEPARRTAKVAGVRQVNCFPPGWPSNTAPSERYDCNVQTFKCFGASCVDYDYAVRIQRERCWTAQLKHRQGFGSPQPFDPAERPIRTLSGCVR